MRDLAQIHQQNEQSVLHEESNAARHRGRYVINHFDGLTLTKYESHSDHDAAVQRLAHLRSLPHNPTTTYVFGAPLSGSTLTRDQSEDRALAALQR